MVHMQAAVSPISRRPLHEETVDRLRDLIVQGRLAPGGRLNERVLCEQLGISRTPLREAIKLLATEGLVDLLPNRGAIVSRIDAAALEARDVDRLKRLLQDHLANKLASVLKTAENVA